MSDRPIVDSQPARPDAASQEHLRVSGLHVSIGSSQILRGVDLILRAGQLTALLGPNGSGKTTLLRAVLGHVRSTSGQVVWLGKPLNAYTAGAMSCVAAYMPQSPGGDAMQTVLECLSLGRSAHQKWFGIDSLADRMVIAEVAAMLELTDLLARRLDTLSGGQRQRVFLGRALVQQPTTLVLDEPSTFLDLKHQVDLYQLLIRLTREKGIAVLMASHDLNLAAAHADRLMLMNRGQIVAHGAPETLMDADLMQRVYEVPMKRVEVDGRAWLVVRG